MTQTVRATATLTTQMQRRDILAKLPTVLNRALGKTQGIVVASPNAARNGFDIENALVRMTVLVVEEGITRHLHLTLTPMRRISKAKCEGKLAQMLFPLIETLKVEDIDWGPNGVRIPGLLFAEALAPLCAVDPAPALVAPRRIKARSEGGIRRHGRIREADKFYDAHVLAYDAHLRATLCDPTLPDLTTASGKASQSRRFMPRRWSKKAIASERQVASVALGLSTFVGTVNATGAAIF